MPFVYDATQRGAEPWLTSVPFDMGGGLALDVAVHSGEARLSRSLYAVPAIGPAHGLDLAYSSRNTASAGMLGYGWSSNLTQTLWRNSTTAPTVAAWTRADGGRVAFYLDGTTWKSTADHREILTVSGTDWTVKEPDQTRLVFSLGTGVSTGRLARIEDRFGKQLAFTWGATSATAASPGGVATTLSYPGGSLITGVTDPAGRTWTLGYTGSDLTCVTDPAANRTRLEYDTSHRIRFVVRGGAGCAQGSGGTSTWTVGYDSSGRVASVADPIAHVSHGDVASTFTYSAGSTVAALLKTYSPTVRNSATYALDNLGRVTQSTDPVNAVTKYGWNTPSSTLAWIDTPLDAGTWTRTAYTYTTSGNLETEIADARSRAVRRRSGHHPLHVQHEQRHHEHRDCRWHARRGRHDLRLRHRGQRRHAGSPGQGDRQLGRPRPCQPPGHRVRVQRRQPPDRRVGARGLRLRRADDDPRVQRPGRGDRHHRELHEHRHHAARRPGLEDLRPDRSSTRDARHQRHDDPGLHGRVGAGRARPARQRHDRCRLTTGSTSYAYDALGRETSETAPDGTTSRTWDELGNELTTTAPGKLVTTRTFDLGTGSRTTAPLQTTTTSTTPRATALGHHRRRHEEPNVRRQRAPRPRPSIRAQPRTSPSRRSTPTTPRARDRDPRSPSTITRTFYDAEGLVTKTVENCTSSGTTVWPAATPAGRRAPATAPTTRPGT